MNAIHPRAPRALLPLALALISVLPTSVHAADKRPSMAGITGIGQGVPMCVDCRAPSAVSITLCHTSTVNVTVGSQQIGSFSTGMSTSSCATVPSVAPDTCVWFQYHYACKNSGLFGLWKCHIVGTSVVVGDNPFC